jgi:hypothetical protein
MRCGSIGRDACPGQPVLFVQGERLLTVHLNRHHLATLPSATFGFGGQFGKVWPDLGAEEEGGGGIEEEAALVHRVDGVACAQVYDATRMDQSSPELVRLPHEVAPDMLEGALHILSTA